MGYRVQDYDALSQEEKAKGEDSFAYSSTLRVESKLLGCECFQFGTFKMQRNYTRSFHNSRKDQKLKGNVVSLDFTLRDEFPIMEVETVNGGLNLEIGQIERKLSDLVVDLAPEIGEIKVNKDFPTNVTNMDAILSSKEIER